jgi:CRISPR-associated endoribonuclease Cas6
MPQKISFITRPKEDFEIPSSEGYQLYSSILEVMREGDEAISEHAHNSPLSSIVVSPLWGRFGRCDRPHHKVVLSGDRYELNMGITDPKEVEIFKSIISPLIFKEKDIILHKGDLVIEEVKSTSISFQELIDSAKGIDNPEVEFWFKSPTCIQYKNSKVSEMFPHREAVFNSLVSKWNAVSPEGLKMGIERDDIGRYVVEKPDPRSYRTHSVVVNTVIDNVKGHPRPIFKQGFSGRCGYSFAKGAPEDVKNAVLILSRFAEYSGVGSAVSRGCGWVEVTVGEVGKCQTMR